MVRGGVEGEVTEDLSGGGVDDGDVVVVGQDLGAGSVVVAADAFIGAVKESSDYSWRGRPALVRWRSAQWPNGSECSIDCK